MSLWKIKNLFSAFNVGMGVGAFVNSYLSLKWHLLISWHLVVKQNGQSWGARGGRGKQFWQSRNELHSILMRSSFSEQYLCKGKNCPLLLNLSIQNLEIRLSRLCLFHNHDGHWKKGFSPFWLRWHRDNQLSWPLQCSRWGRHSSPDIGKLVNLNFK